MKKLLVTNLASKAISSLLLEKYSRVAPSLRRNFSAFGQLITQPKPNHLLFHSDKGSLKMENHFSFDDYDAIGFDLDNTVIRYNVQNMLYHEYKVLSEFLVERGYSKDFLMMPVEDGSDFMQKGLILDFERGNLLRICPDGHIQSGSHGSTFMTVEQIIAIYGEKKTWKVTDEYCKDMLVAWNGTMADQIRTCLDYFDMPAALCFARIIDSIDHQKGGPQEKYTVWPDVLAGLMAMYNRENFAKDTSKYFTGLQRNPAKFIRKCDPKVLEWLKELKKKKTTFILTGSHIDFASHTAGFAIGEDWRDYFDIAICYAKKPGFFTMNRPFLTLCGNDETGEIKAADMKAGEAYSQGNYPELKKFINSSCKMADAKVVYVGDNLIQDVFTPNKHMKVDTVAIVEEMLAEGVDADPNFKVLQSNVWGSYFHVAKEDTLWEKIIRKHAKICVPSIDVLASHPIDYKFTAFDPKNHSSCGYHPHDPTN